jgi:1-acyl-sn-glycerol-3-phosphate acyltransferase
MGISIGEAISVRQRRPRPEGPPTRRPDAQRPSGPRALPGGRAARWGRMRFASPTIFVMNVWVVVLMFVETLVALAISPVLLVLWRLATRWPPAQIVRHFIWLYGRVWLWIVAPFVRLKVVGAEYTRRGQPCIYVANHLSFFDIFFLSAMPVFDVVVCLRSWPFRLAWYAPFMRFAQYVDVERLHWEQIVPKIEQIVGEGRSVLLFPQGHRSRDGRLGRFYSGAFKLAVQLQLPIVPVCIQGTDQMLPPGRRWMAPAEVRLECLKPIDSTAFPGDLGHIELRKHVKELMGACLAGSPS